MRGETRASAIVLLHARVQYSSKLMQYNACSKLYKTYCIADVAACSAFIIFFQPQNTANRNAGSDTANDVTPFQVHLLKLWRVYGSL